jgi:hypothetical protein
MTMKTHLTGVLVYFVIAVLSGCSSVPKEAVDLSYQIGQDTEALHQSYRKLIKAHYQLSRRIIEQEWTKTELPTIIKNAIEEGRLVDVAAGKVVFDPATQNFVKPTPGAEFVQREQTMQTWSKEVADIIAQNRAGILDPIDQEEQKLLESVDAAFAQVARGNAAISAHLASLRKVQETQDSVLDKAGMKELRDQINNSLIKLSDEASKDTGRLSELREEVGSLKDKLNGGQ